MINFVIYTINFSHSLLYIISVFAGINFYVFIKI